MHVALGHIERLSNRYVEGGTPPWVRLFEQGAMLQVRGHVSDHAQCRGPRACFMMCCKSAMPIPMCRFSCMCGCHAITLSSSLRWSGSSEHPSELRAQYVHVRNDRMCGEINVLFVTDSQTIVSTQHMDFKFTGHDHGRSCPVCRCRLTMHELLPQHLTETDCFQHTSYLEAPPRIIYHGACASTPLRASRSQPHKMLFSTRSVFTWAR